MLNTKLHACTDCYFQKHLYDFFIDERSTTSDLHSAETIIFAYNTPLQPTEKTTKVEFIIGSIIGQCLHDKEKIFWDEIIAPRTYKGNKGTGSLYPLALENDKKQLGKALGQGRVFIVTNNRRLETLLPLLPTNRPTIILHGIER